MMHGASIYENDHWHVVEVRGGSMDSASQEIDKAGFMMYRPKYMDKVLHRKTSKVIDKEVDMFPGYLFVSTSPDYIPSQPLDVLYRSHNVIRVLTKEDGTTPYIVEPEEMMLVREIAELSKGDQLQRKTPKTWRIGQALRFVAGPFTGFTAVLKKYAGKFHVKVEVEMVGQIVTLKVPPVLVEPV